jgi:hypothetical protein
MRRENLLKISIFCVYAVFIRMDAACNVKMLNACLYTCRIYEITRINVRRNEEYMRIMRSPCESPESALKPSNIIIIVIQNSQEKSNISHVHKLPFLRMHK